MREDLILKLLNKIAKEENCKEREEGELFKEKARELIEEDPFLKMLDTVAKESGIVSFEEFCERRVKGESSESIFKEYKGE